MMKRSRIKSVLIGIVAIGLLSVAKANAALLVQVSDATLVAGGATDIEVFVQSSTNDSLDIFSYQLQISVIDSPLGTLTFSPVQLFDGTDVGYLFTGQSGNLSVVPLGSILNGTDVTSDTALDILPFPPFTATETFNGPVIPSNPTLLTRVRVEHDNAFASGGTFLIDLVAASSEFLTDVTAVNFGSPTGTPLAFSSTAGTITVTAVPEPSGAFVLAGILAAYRVNWGGLIRKRRQRFPEAETSRR